MMTASGQRERRVFHSRTKASRTTTGSAPSTSKPLPHRADLHVVLAAFALVAAHGDARVDEATGHAVTPAAGVGAPARGGVAPNPRRLKTSRPGCLPILTG